MICLFPTLPQPPGSWQWSLGRVHLLGQIVDARSRSAFRGQSGPISPLHFCFDHFEHAARLVDHRKMAFMPSRPKAHPDGPHHCDRNAQPTHMHADPGQARVQTDHAPDDGCQAANARQYPGQKCCDPGAGAASRNRPRPPSMRPSVVKAARPKARPDQDGHPPARRGVEDGRARGHRSTQRRE